MSKRGKKAAKKRAKAQPIPQTSQKGVGSEGSWRGPFSGIGELGHSFTIGAYDNGWQRNLAMAGCDDRVAAIFYNCALNARAACQCEPLHIQEGEDGEWKRNTTSPAARVLHRPNRYENRALFIFNLVMDLLGHGESICIAVTDGREAIQSLHRIPRNCWSIHIHPETKDIFYGINEQDMFDTPNLVVPARKVAHFRMHCPRHQMVGESPIRNAALAAGINVALNKSQLAFFTNMSRPSGVLSTEQELDRDQITQLADRFREVSAQWNQGHFPVLSSGLKFQPTNVAQGDAQLVEQQRLSIVEICRIYGTPMAIFAETGGPAGGTEALIQHWISTGLGAVIETMEREFETLFDLGPRDSIQLDTSPLLRADLKTRFEALGAAVQNGLMTPNEGRRRERLGKVEGGDELFLQRQMTPINLLPQIAANDASTPTPPAIDVTPEAPEPEDEQMPNDEARAMLMGRMKQFQLRSDA